MRARVGRDALVRRRIDRTRTALGGGLGLVVFQTGRDIASAFLDRPRGLHGTRLDHFAGLGGGVSGLFARHFGVRLDFLLFSGRAGRGAHGKGGDGGEGEGLYAHGESPFSVEPWRLTRGRQRGCADGGWRRARTTDRAVAPAQEDIRKTPPTINGAAASAVPAPVRHITDYRFLRGWFSFQPGR